MPILNRLCIFTWWLSVIRAILSRIYSHGMKRIILYLFVPILLISCHDTGKEKPKNKASDNTGAPKTDSTTAAWLLKKDRSGKVFLNTIRLKDGQEEAAGLSFFPRMVPLKFIVSAKPLLGPASGFSQEI